MARTGPAPSGVQRTRMQQLEEQAQREDRKRWLLQRRYAIAERESRARRAYRADVKILDNMLEEATAAQRKNNKRRTLAAKAKKLARPTGNPEQGRPLTQVDIDRFMLPQVARPRVVIDLESDEEIPSCDEVEVEPPQSPTPVFEVDHFEPPRAATPVPVSAPRPLPSDTGMLATALLTSFGVVYVCGMATSAWLLMPYIV